MFQGGLQKEVTKGYPHLVLSKVIKMSNMSKQASKLPKHLKFLEYPIQECLYFVIQASSKPISTLKPFWSNIGAERKEKYI